MAEKLTPQELVDRAESFRQDWYPSPTAQPAENSVTGLWLATSDALKQMLAERTSRDGVQYGVRVRGQRSDTTLPCASKELARLEQASSGGDVMVAIMHRRLGEQAWWPLSVDLF